MTTCTEFVARLGAPGTAQDQELCAHLETCAECKALAATAQALAATAQAPAPERLAHFATRTRAAQLRQKEQSQRRGPLWAGAFAVAGAAAVALVLGLALPHRAAAPAAAPIAEAPRVPPAPTVAAPAAPLDPEVALEELATDLGLEEDDLLALLDDLDDEDFDGAI